MYGWKVEFNDCEWILCLAQERRDALALGVDQSRSLVGADPYENGALEDGQEPEVSRCPQLDGLESFTEQDLVRAGLQRIWEGETPDADEQMVAVFLSTEY